MTRMGWPKVHQDEEHAHDQRGDGQKLTQDGDLAVGLVVVQIVGQHHHHASGGHADQEGEVGDVKSPGDIPAHAGDAQAELQLLQVDQEADAGQAEQEDHPCPIPFTSFYG